MIFFAFKQIPCGKVRLDCGKNLDCDVLVKRAWSEIPIKECGEELVDLKEAFLCMEPHPYLSIGAPYGQFADPWRLRSGVFSRLVLAQKYLQLDNPELYFGIFDAWRPIPVQAFMVEHSITENCIRRGIDQNDPIQQKAVAIVAGEVARFWAVPSHEPSTPPPHSTGAAIDLTLANSDGVSLDMGGKIDQLGSISSPNYFCHEAKNDKASRLFHQRRVSLATAMIKAGFVQHPNEWWHFSYGDQLWAWKCNKVAAHYGACNPSASNNLTFSSPRHST